MIEVDKIIEEVNKQSYEIAEEGFDNPTLDRLEEFVKDQMVSALTRYMEYINDHGYEGDMDYILERFIEIHKLSK